MGLTLAKLNIVSPAILDGNPLANLRTDSLLTYV